MNTIEPLEWDSKHFGHPIARISGPVRTPDALQGCLAEAGRRGLWLVYWLSEDRFEVPSELLGRFGGRRIIGHSVFRRQLSADDLAGSDKIAVRSALGESLSEELRQLGVMAGELSRFRVDDRIPRERFESLYSLWIERSLSGALASEVLLATGPSGAPAALVTYRIRGGPMAEIGLVSTHPTQRGHGYARRLLEHAHRNMWSGGVRMVDVVTQTENEAACRLYLKAGYSLVSSGSYYHFMPTPLS